MAYSGTEILEAVEAGIVSSNSEAENATILRAVSAAAKAITVYTHWWWAWDTGEFDTVADTQTYTMRTVNSNNMPNFRSADRVFYEDDWSLQHLSRRDYQAWSRVVRPTDSTGKPLAYNVAKSPPVMSLRPVPDAAYTIYVEYWKRHEEVTEATQASELIVPEEAQHQIYIECPIWILRHKIMDIQGVLQCPAFQEAVQLLALADPDRGSGQNPEDYYVGAKPGFLPHNRRVIRTSDGYLISEDVSI